MARVSDKTVDDDTERYINKQQPVEVPPDYLVGVLLDLRDARALLREALGYVDEYTRLANDFGTEDALRRGSQHLEGKE